MSTSNDLPPTARPDDEGPPAGGPNGWPLWSAILAGASWLRGHPKLLTAAVVLWVVFALRQSVRIEPFAMQEDLSYDGKVAAARFVHYLRAITRKANTDKVSSHAGFGHHGEPLLLNAEHLELPRLSIGVVSFDSGALLRLLQYSLSYGTDSVSGQITRAGDQRLVLTLQGSLFGESTEVMLEDADGNVDRLLENAAQELLGRVDPLRMAVYWSNLQERPESSAKAKELIRRTIQDPDRQNDAQAYLLWGWLLTREKNYAEAIDKYQLAEGASDDTDAVAYDNWAWALQQMESFQRAEDLYRKALSLDPTNQYSNNHLALALYQQPGSDLQEAHRHCARAIEANPLYAEACELCAAIVVRMGEGETDRKPPKGTVDEAIRHVRRAIELKPDHCPSYNTLAKLLQQNGGSLDDVIGALEAGMSVAQCQRGRALANLRYDFEQAHRMCPAWS